MTPLTVARQATLSMEFSKQEYWIGLPFPTLGDLLDPGIKAKSPVSPALAGEFFTTEPPGKPGVISTLTNLSIPLKLSAFLSLSYFCLSINNR